MFVLPFFLMHLSYLQKDEPNYFPDFLNSVLLSSNFVKLGPVVALESYLSLQRRFRSLIDMIWDPFNWHNFNIQIQVNDLVLLMVKWGIKATFRKTLELKLTMEASGRLRFMIKPFGCHVLLDNFFGKQCQILQNWKNWNEKTYTRRLLWHTTYFSILLLAWKIKKKGTQKELWRRKKNESWN